jgi:hypothetical protein
MKAQAAGGAVFQAGGSLRLPNAFHALLVPTAFRELSPTL